MRRNNVLAIRPTKRVGARSTAAFLVLSFPMLDGCASTQLTANTVEVAARVDYIYTQQTLNNFSKFVDDPYAIPSQAQLSTSQIQTTNTVQPSVTFPFTSQFANTVASATSGVTRTNATTLAGAGATLQGVNSQQQNFTVSPLIDAVTLRNQQALYRHALLQHTPLLGNYQPPRIFFNSRFYLDPYFIQRPQCVLCAIQQHQQPYVFSDQVPVPPLEENKRLPGHWIFADGDKNQLRDPVDLGHFGNHELYMSKAQYYAGVLTDFVLFTLSFTVPAEILTGTPPKQGPTIIEIAPYSPPPPASGPKSELPTPPPARYIIPAPPVTIPPATNQQFQPADRQNTILTTPTGIIPPP
jgi:hypothetical protein